MKARGKSCPVAEVLARYSATHTDLHRTSRCEGGIWTGDEIYGTPKGAKPWKHQLLIFIPRGGLAHR